MKVYNPHDILKIKSLDYIIEDTASNPWVETQLENFPYVVVRRGLCNDTIPIGIRGKFRDQRFAATISKESVIETYTPFEISLKIIREDQSKLPPVFVNVFDILSELYSHLPHNYKLGITGSFMHEYVTSDIAVTDESDLDLILDVPELSKEVAKEIAKRINELQEKHGRNIDTILWYQNMYLPLEEFISSNSPYLFKTLTGEELVDIGK